MAGNQHRPKAPVLAPCIGFGELRGNQPNQIPLDEEHADWLHKGYEKKAGLKRDAQQSRGKADTKQNK